MRPFRLLDVFFFAFCCGGAAAGEDAPVTLEGAVQEGGELLSGAELLFEPLELFHPDGRIETGEDLRPPLVSVQTDRDGWYLTERVPPGIWHVVIIPRPLTSDYPRLGNIPPPPRPDVTLPQEFRVVIPREAEVERSFGWEISDVAGRVVDAPGGQPVAGVTVLVTRPEDELENRIQRRLFQYNMICMRTDGSGRFRARGLEPGEYRIHAGGPGQDGVEPNLRRSEAVSGRIREGDLVDDVELVLNRPGRRLFGRVLDADGRPARECVVRLFNASGGEETSSLGIRIDKSGEFRAAGLGPGPYAIVVAQVRGVGLKSPALAIVSDVRVPENGVELRTIRMRQGTEVSVRVEWTTGSALDRRPDLRVLGPFGAALARFTRFGSARVVRDDRLRPGTARMESSSRLPPGRYTISARYGGREDRRVIDVGSEPVSLSLDVSN